MARASHVFAADTLPVLHYCARVDHITLICIILYKHLEEAEGEGGGGLHDGHVVRRLRAGTREKLYIHTYIYIDRDLCV